MKGGGCSGLEYSIGLISEYEPDWNSYEFGAVNIFIDQISEMYLDGTTVDYVESLEQSGFKFTNPQMKTGCGCGKSFSV